jgi:cell division protein FtsI (penicillin-binding protein 3)
MKTSGHIPSRTVMPQPAVVAVEGGASQPIIPDLRGASAREALRLLAQLGLSARIEGAGIVVAQTPEPGTPLERGVTCTLVLRRDSPAAPGTAGAQP